MSKLPELYLEISARATGKTYRLFQAVNSWLNEGGHNIAFVYGNSRINKHLLSSQLIEDKNLNRIFYNQNEWISCGGPIRKFYDEFDFINFKLEENTQYYKNYHYYVTTPSKIRAFEDIIKNETNKKDNLLNLIKLNNGKYNCYSILSSYLDINILKNYFNEPGFQNEYLAKWI